MKRRFILALAAIIMTNAQANSEITVQPKAVFMGDSITQCWYDVIEGMILKVLK